MAKRKPRVEFYWSPVTRAQESGINPTTKAGKRIVDHRVNWRLVGANGETMCSCTQGFRDKIDAMRSVAATIMTFVGYPAGTGDDLRFVGPGPKPKADGE